MVKRLVNQKVQTFKLIENYFYPHFASKLKREMKPRISNIDIEQLKEQIEVRRELR